MKSIFCIALVLLLVGCVSRPPKADLPNPGTLREKLGFSDEEWTVVDSALASLVARRAESRLGGDFVFAGAEYLRPGVVVVYLAEMFAHELAPCGELRFHRVNGKWVQQQMILAETDRREGMFISMGRFEELLQKEDERLLSGLRSDQIDSTYILHPFDPPRDKRSSNKRVNIVSSRLPAPRVWKELLERFDYRDEVFVIHTPGRTVIALKIRGDFRYVIHAAFDFQSTFLHLEMQKTAQPGATDNLDGA